MPFFVKDSVNYSRNFQSLILSERIFFNKSFTLEGIPVSNKAKRQILKRALQENKNRHFLPHDRYTCVSRNFYTQLAFGGQLLVIICCFFVKPISSYERLNTNSIVRCFELSIRIKFRSSFSVPLHRKNIPLRNRLSKVSMVSMYK